MTTRQAIHPAQSPRKKSGLDASGLAWRRRILAGGLACALNLASVNRGRAEESHADYRYQIYREDNDRIAVDTHSALFDVSINAKARLQGEVVIDAVSGATPSGAPAYKDFHLLSVNQVGLNAVSGNYANLMSTLGYTGNPQGFIDYVRNNFPGFLPTLLSTYSDATNSYAQALAANPNYRSAKVPLSPEHDERESLSFSVPVSFGHNTLTPGLSYSEESDYVSISTALNYSRDFNDKNTTLNIGWSHDFDSVRDYWEFDGDGNFLWKSKNTDEIIIGINQLINPKAYVTLNFTYGHSTGYLNDQYRQIYAANAIVTTDLAIDGQPSIDQSQGLAILDGWRPEQRPHEKDKYVGYLSYVQFITPLQGSVETSYRFYNDSYGVTGHTVDAAWHQKIGRNIMLSPAFRYYRQSAAKFYYYMFPDYNYWNPANPQYNNYQYYSADYRLSEFESFTYSVSLTWRIGKNLSLDATYSRYLMHGLDGVTAQDMYPNADLFGFGAKLWF